MAGQRQPIALVQAKGKKHLTKAEIAERERTEVKAPSDRVTPPSYLTATQKKAFRKTVKELRAIDLISNLDVEALARLVIAQEKYREVTETIAKQPLMVTVAYDTGKKDAEGNPIIKNGQHLLDEDLSEIADSYLEFKNGNLIESEFRFSVAYSELDKASLSFNPVHYLPQHNAAFRKVITIGEREDFEIHRLGDLANVFNGPRFKRPYADLGVTNGPSIRKYFTGTALTQLNSDNIKYLDSSKASPQVKRQLDDLTIYKGYILVSDSGTLGRVTYALSQHDGHVATNNLIRIVVDDIPLRGYLYEFLKSELGQSLMLKNAYGTNQEHLEPDVIADIPIPVPKSRELIESIGDVVIRSIEDLEQSIEASNSAKNLLNTLME